MSDPSAVTGALETARDAFEYVGHGRPDFEEGIEQDADWTVQLTKACRYLEACRLLRERDGYNGACIELCFAATEPTVEAYLLWATDDSLEAFHDYERVYDRAAAVGLFSPETAELTELYSRNRTEHYYGGVIPTQQKEDAMYGVAESVHRFAIDQIREGDVCSC